jgi:hemoglobin
MKKVVTIAIILIAFVTVGYTSLNSTPSTIPSTSLYERLGEEKGITELVDEVVEAHLKNPIISARFAPYKDKPERLAKIKGHTVMFFCMGSGGPQKYAGRDLPSTHGGMNISATEYMAVVDDILMVCENRKIDEQSRKDVLAILWSLKDAIMAK